MERICAFLPSVLLIAVIAGATHLYLKWVIKRFGDNLKSVEWCKNNRLKIAWTIGTPLTSVYAPAVEELIFRAPLIIAFGDMSSVAWYGVFASSGLFALMHWFGKKIGISEIISVRENGNHKSDELGAEINRVHMEAGRLIIVRKVLHVIFTLPLGILAGYYSIEYQSVWVAFGIHSIWNLIMSTAISFVVFLGTLIFLLICYLIQSLWGGVREIRESLK